MNEPVVGVACAQGSSVPEYKTEGSAGADLRANLKSTHGGTLTLEPGARVLVPTGLRMQIPEGYEAQVRSRSGLAVEYGVVCLNSPGTIDSDYRGEIQVILANLGDRSCVISDGDRIAQLIIAPVARAIFSLSDSMEDTKRGTAGFGSTGR